MVGPGGGLTAEDVAAALGDSALLAIDDIADAIAAGQASRLREALKKAWVDEANAVTILRGCQSYFRHLGLAGHAMKQGQTAQDALRALRPSVHFKLQAGFRRNCGAGPRIRPFRWSGGFKILN